MVLTRRQKCERQARKAAKDAARNRMRHELWMQQNESVHVRKWDKVKRYGKDSVLSKVMF